ncbi:MAG: 4Fe-4S binding protein [Candidatus Melainabacteria bacterium]|nr:MAG: 4Fe-4S binding protein [Candidatus Melainabacteria bacterium]
MLPIDNSNPSIVRDPNKCILCGACVRACSEFQRAFCFGGLQTVGQKLRCSLLQDASLLRLIAFIADNVKLFARQEL